MDARESTWMTSYFLDEEYVGWRPGRRQELAWSQTWIEHQRGPGEFRGERWGGDRDGKMLMITYSGKSGEAGGSGEAKRRCHSDCQRYTKSGSSSSGKDGL